MAIDAKSIESPYFHGTTEVRPKGISFAAFNNNPGNIMYYQVALGSGKILRDKSGKPKISSYAQHLINKGFKIKPGAANEHGVFIKLIGLTFCL